MEESSSVQYSTWCTIEKGTQNTTCSHVLGIVLQLNPFLPKSSQHTFTEYIFRNLPHFFQKELITTQYSSSKSVTHLAGLQEEEPGRLPLADFPGSPRFHTIDLEVLNQNTHHRFTKTELSKTKAIAFGRNNLTSVSVKPSVTQAEVS